MARNLQAKLSKCDDQCDIPCCRFTTLTRYEGKAISTLLFRPFTSSFFVITITAAAVVVAAAAISLLLVYNYRVTRMIMDDFTCKNKCRKIKNLLSPYKGFY